MKDKLRRNIFEGVIYQGISMLLSMLWVFLAARKLGASEMGMLLVVFNVYNTVMILFSMGVQQSFSVVSGMYSEVRLASNGIVVIVFLGLIASLFFFVGYFWLIDKNMDPLILVVILFFLFIYTYTGSLLRALHVFRVANVLSLFLYLLFDIFLLFMFCIDDKMSLFGVLKSYMVAVIVSAVFSVLMVYKKIGFNYFYVNIDTMRTIVHMGGKMQFGNIMKELMYRADLYLVAFYLGTSAAGMYGVVLKLVEAAGRFVDAVGMVLLPYISKSENKVRSAITAKVISLVLPGSLLMSVVISIFSGYAIMILYGNEYIHAELLLRIGIFSVIPIAIWKVLASDFIGRGIAYEYSLSSLFGAISIVGINIIMIQKYGLISVPVTLIVSYGVAALYLVLMYKKKTGVAVRDVMLFRNVK